MQGETDDISAHAGAGCVPHHPTRSAGPRQTSVQHPGHVVPMRPCGADKHAPHSMKLCGSPISSACFAICAVERGRVADRRPAGVLPAHADHMLPRRERPAATRRKPAPPIAPMPAVFPRRASRRLPARGSVDDERPRPVEPDVARAVDDPDAEVVLTGVVETADRRAPRLRGQGERERYPLLDPALTLDQRLRVRVPPGAVGATQDSVLAAGDAGGRQRLTDRATDSRERVEGLATRGRGDTQVRLDRIVDDLGLDGLRDVNSGGVALQRSSRARRDRPGAFRTAACVPALEVRCAPPIALRREPVRIRNPGRCSCNPRLHPRSG